MEMRALYYIALPTERSGNMNEIDYEADVKANENCLNQNFTLIADKLYELETLLNALIEASSGTAAE
ncbi:MAG: hypothetical protein ACI4OB_08420 [Christensenellales bacterium]